MVPTCAPAPTSSAPSSAGSGSGDTASPADPSDDDLAAARNLVDDHYTGLSASTEGGLTSYADSYSATVHAAVLDGEAYFFQPCEP